MRILLLGLFLVCAAVGEQAAALRLTLGQALELTEKSNPELLLSDQSIHVARSSVTIAGQRPNPTLGLAVPIGPAERKQSLLLNVPLETGGRREARLAVAEDIVKEADLGRLQVRLGVLNQTRNAFVELAVAQSALEQSQRDLEFFDRLVEAAKRKFQAGDVAEAEVIRAVFEREQRTGPRTGPARPCLCWPTASSRMWPKCWPC